MDEFVAPYQAMSSDGFVGTQRWRPFRIVVCAWALSTCGAEATPPSRFENIVTLIVGIAWPLTALLLIFLFRNTLRRLLTIVERRVAQGDTLNAFGISVQGAGAPLPAATSLPEQDAGTARVFADVLRLSGASNVLIALGELSKGDDESAVVGTGDALGLAAVQAKLLRVEAGSVTSTVIRKEGLGALRLLDRYDHVITIGGPEANYLSRTIMSLNYLTFEFKPGGIYDKVEQTLNTVKFSPDAMNGTDWAILLIVSHPRHTAGRAVVLAGYSGYGTNAAAVVFSRLEEFTSLHRHDSLEALVRVEIEKGVVGSPEVVTVRTIPTVEPLKL